MASSRSRSPKLRIRSPSSLHRKQSSKSGENDEQRVEFLGNGMENIGGGNANKVMVVVDSTIQAKGALDWALSHTIQSQDTIVLLYVTNNSSKRKGSDCNMKKANLRAYELLHSMKNLCQSKRPGVEVEIGIREGKEKGPIIVEEAKQRRVSLLVLGQRKRSIMWRLIRRLGRRRNGCGGGAADYCIQNSSCMTIAVRRKGKKLGGYLITTKRHKKFWLLA
ncbi:uncharacterized protein [Euphorbia lathyris]|uniref:uncharacterized protein n=1 Tax=Euphorbia lathyris TaxID=212925 RepID=UPI003313C1E3